MLVVLEHRDHSPETIEITVPISTLMWIYVTGSGKRDIFARTMIFRYKRCCSKTRSIFYSLKKFFFFLLNGIYNSLPTLTPNLTERPSNWSSALLKDGY